MITVAVYDTRPYDRQYLEHSPGSERLQWRFHEFRLNLQTAVSANGCQVVCAFVNDRLDRSCLQALAQVGV